LGGVVHRMISSPPQRFLGEILKLAERFPPLLPCHLLFS